MTTPRPMKPVPSTYCPPIVTLRSPISTTRPVSSGPNIGRVVAIDENRVDPLEDTGLPVDAVGSEDMALRVEADHENIRPHASFATLPFGKAEIDRRRLLHIGRGPDRAELG